MSNPTELTPREHTLRIILMIAACFAIGSIGVFAAVYIQNLSAERVIESSSSTHELTLTDAQKQAVLDSLAASSGTSTKSVANNHVSPSQADIHDPLAAQKLKVLESLSVR